MKGYSDYFQSMSKKEFKHFLKNSEIKFEEEGSGEIIYTDPKAEVKLATQSISSLGESANKSKKS